MRLGISYYKRVWTCKCTKATCAFTSSSFCWSTVNVSIGQWPGSRFGSLAPRRGRFRRAGFRLCFGSRRFSPPSRCSGPSRPSSLLRGRRAVFTIIGIIVVIVKVIWWCAYALPASRCCFGLSKLKKILCKTNLPDGLFRKSFNGNGNETNIMP